MNHLKKFSLVVLGCFLFGQVAQSQPVSDREVVPMAVTLNQILRLNVVSGGNMEFVFNTIQDYKDGINDGGGATGGPPGANTADFYETELTIAASVNWDLYYGAQDDPIPGTDDNANTMPINNVGWAATSEGNYSCGAEWDCSNWGPAGGPGSVEQLEVYPTMHTTNGTGNAGDVNDNDLLITWRVGTQEGNMVGTSLLDQNLEPDRYVTNVLFDLRQN